MRDLLSRLAVGDEEASAALRVLDYFDNLDLSAPGPEAYVRGAAGLSGVAAGMSLPNRRLEVRVDASGRRLPAAMPRSEWVMQEIARSGGGSVWIESEESSTTSRLIVERLAQGVARWCDRMDTFVPTPEQAWTILLNDSVSEDRRTQLIAALKLDAHSYYRVYAYAGLDQRQHHVLISATAEVNGLPVRVDIVPASVAVTAVIGRSTEKLPLRPLGPSITGGRAGIGSAEKPENVLRSWGCARNVLRMARYGEALEWDRARVFGALFLHASPEDVLADSTVAIIAREQIAWLDETVNALTRAKSVRGAAAILGLHHSTVQKRVDWLQETFDLNLSNSRHLFYLWLGCVAYRWAVFGTEQDPWASLPS